MLQRSYRTSDVEETENRKVDDNHENSKHTQNKETIDTKKRRLPNNWKMVPLFVDKISFLFSLVYRFICILITYRFKKRQDVRSG